MIIWLASYPKSGNTYLRAFLSAYYFSQDGKFEFNQIEHIKQFRINNFLIKKLKVQLKHQNNGCQHKNELSWTKKLDFLKLIAVWGTIRVMSLLHTKQALVPYI